MLRFERHRINISQIAAGAIFVAAAIALPMAFHTVGLSIVLSPLQVPVLLAAAVLPTRVSMLVAILAPLLSSLLLAMPPLWPIAILMAIELLAAVLILRLVVEKTSGNMFLAVLGAAVAGRLTYATMQYVIWRILGWGTAAWIMVLLDLFVATWPAIILQLVLIPLLARWLSRHMASRL